jgi:hypothetical protein
VVPFENPWREALVADDNKIECNQDRQGEKPWTCRRSGVDAHLTSRRLQSVHSEILHSSLSSARLTYHDVKSVSWSVQPDGCIDWSADD